MRRRTLLKSLLVLSGLPLIYKRAQAFITLNGFAANDETPARINSLTPDWINIDLGSYSGNLNYNYGATKFALNLSNVTDAEIQQYLPAAMSHPSYDHWFILLNEPSEWGSPASNAAFIANRQIALVLSIDPLARFCLSCGTGVHPPSDDNSYAEQLWALITNKSVVKAFGVTYYPYQSVPRLRQFLTAFNAWRSGKQHWILEMGIVTGVAPTVKIAAAGNGVPAVIFTLPNAFAEANLQGMERVSWYAEKAIVNTPAAEYDCLLDSNNNFTPTGQQWLAM